MDDAKQIALIADDDEFFRMAIRAILVNQLGMAEVIETGSLDQALEALSQQGGVTVALFDLAMPGMQSPASLGAVRELFPSTRVVVVSGSQRRSDILMALEAGVHGYVAKGIGAQDLAKALKVVLEGMIYIPPSLPQLPSSAESGTDFGGATAVANPAANMSALTPRQRQVLDLIVSGQSNKEIARTLQLGEGTIKVHLAALFRTLGVTNRAAAAAAGARILSGSRR